jgi:maleate isomerase
VYGNRARIGYIAPLLFIEIYPYEFYKMAPEGVTLMVATQTLLDNPGTEYEENFRSSARLAREMAKAGASIVVLGGATPNYTVGADRVYDFVRDAERDCGIPVTTALDAQLDALKTMGSKRLAVILPAAGGSHEHFRQFGFDIVGSTAGGYQLRDFGSLPIDTPAVLARQLAREHPEADTIFFPAAHWPAAANIEALEQELGKTVISSAQAILWHALRRCAVNDPVPGYGRLFREH